MKIHFYTQLVFFLVFISAQARALAQPITLNVQQQPLENVLKTVQQQSGYAVIYNPNLLDDANPVTVQVKDENVDAVLALVFANQPLRYEIKDGVVTVALKRVGASSETSYQDDIIPAVSGTVSDLSGNPLEKATIRVLAVNEAKTPQVTTSDRNGRFLLKNVLENTR